MPKFGERLNVLLFLFDSLGTDDYLSLAESLPSISAIQSQGNWFSKAYCSSPESAPARASLFTGLDMAVHGVWTDGVALPEHEEIVSERFSQNGYQTWLFGRRQLAGVSNWTTEHTRAGEYDQVEWAHGPLHQSRQNAYLSWLQARANTEYDKLFPTQANPDDTDIPDWQRHAITELPDELSFNSWIGASLAERVEQHATDQPFFAVAGFVVGESMGAEPDQNCLIENLDYKALQQADAAVGAVLQSLEAAELLDNTLVVIASSRGSADAQANHNPLREQAIKVPLIISKSTEASQSVDLAVSTMDLVPTLYQLAKIKPPTRIQGRSLLTEEPRQWSLSRLRNPGHPQQTALCTERYKLIVIHGQPHSNESARYQLYDLQQDPAQINDLADSASHQQELEAMIDQLIDARVALEDRTEPRTAKF